MYNYPSAAPATSPRPWTICASTPSLIEDAEGNIVGQAHEIYSDRVNTKDRRTGEMWGNAILVVNAVNSHDALVEVLREVIDETAFYQARFTSKEWRAKARAALVKAGA